MHPCISDSQPHRITSTKCRKNTVVSPDNGPIVPKHIEIYKYTKNKLCTMLVLLTRSVLILSLSHQCAGFAIPKLTICRNFSPASNALHTPPTNLTDPIVKMFGKVFWYRKLELQS